ncbi:hypothetical protein INR49_003862 [Caranx melampygus]|nr:hypothetical protein INR49_003862 [Caranx melampygus]
MCSLSEKKETHDYNGRLLDVELPWKHAERKWTGPFCFIQAADPQLGLMKAWREGDCDGGGDEWAEEVELTKQAVEAVNQLVPRPRFMVLCGDLVHAMPGMELTEVDTCCPLLT